MRCLKMGVGSWIILFVALSAPGSTFAEDRVSNNLSTILRDAAYTFNRFEEVSVGVEAQIDTNYPAQIRVAASRCYRQCWGM
jgi:hypothetical protein